MKLQSEAGDPIAGLFLSLVTREPIFNCRVSVALMFP